MNSLNAVLLYCTCLPPNSRGPACFTSTLKGTCCLPTSCFFTASCSWPTGKWPSRRQAPCSCWTMHILHWGSGHSGQHAGCSHLLHVHEYLLYASLITAIIHLVQNIFNKDPSHRTISLNDTYIILFKNPRNKSKQLYPSSNMILTPPTPLSWPCLPTATWPLTQTGDIRWVTRGTFHLHNNTLFPNEDFPEASAYCPTSKDWANTRPRLRQWCFHSPACMLTMAARVCHYHHSNLHVDDKDIGSWPHHYSQTQQPHAAMQHCNTMTAGTKKWRWVCPCSMIPCNLCRNMHPICILAKAQPKVVRHLISCTYKDLIQTSQSVPPAPWWYCSAIAAGQAHICPEGPQVQDGQSAWQEGPADWRQLFRPAGQHHSPLLIK